MPFTVIQCRIFRAKIIGYGIARREPPAHLLDAGATLLCSAVCCGVCGVLSGAARYALSGGYCSKVRVRFIVLFVK
jgi:hypothetical protein